MVIAGEIALERLQHAIKLRLERPASRFNNHYELAAYLYDVFSTRFGLQPDWPSLGRVDELLQLLQAAKIDAPAALQPRLEVLHVDTELRPIAEQIIDQILSENSSFYETYSRIRAKSEQRPMHRTVQRRSRLHNVHAEDVDTHAFGAFVKKWIEFERVVREVAHSTMPSEQARMSPFPKVLGQLGLFDNEVLFRLQEIRRIRNNLVHGVEPYPTDVIRQATSYLDATIRDLQRR